MMDNIPGNPGGTYSVLPANQLQILILGIRRSSRRKSPQRKSETRQICRVSLFR
jgi:hypothetical protein